MARAVIKTAKKPFELKVGDKIVNICMCGLSKNQPFCDGSHMNTLDEKDDTLYQYDEKGKRMTEDCCGGDKKDGACCGGGHCGEKPHEK